MNSTTTPKTCTGCNQAKTLSEYHRRNNSKVGYYPRCKDCERERHKDNNRKLNFSVSVIEKLCPKCRVVEPASEFSRHKGFTTGLASHCHGCVRDASRIWLQRLKFKTFQAYSNRCACCGERQPEFLSIDHIGGGGKQHRATLSPGSSSLYLDLQRRGHPQEGFRLLCHNCNQSLGVHGYCPHQSESKEAA